MKEEGSAGHITNGQKLGTVLRQHRASHEETHNMHVWVYVSCSFPSFFHETPDDFFHSNHFPRSYLETVAG